MGIRVDNTNNKQRPPAKVVIASTVGALAGSGLYVASLAKHKQGSNIFKKISSIELGIKEGILLCTTATLGGLIPGAVLDKKENLPTKLYEASHQIIGNGAIPFACLGIANYFTKGLNKTIRSAIAITTLFVSTFLGHSVTDKLNNTPNKYKVSFIDFLPDVDDWVLAASTVLNSKLLYKFTAMVCPFTYSIMGIKTGLAQKDNKKLDKIV